MTTFPNARKAGYFLLTALALPSLALAASPPNAGQTLREIQQTPSVAPKAAPDVSIENKAAHKPAPGSNVQIPVKSIRIEGNTVFPDSELMPLVAGLAGGKHTLAELDAAAARITSYYHKRGYIVARAYIPAQKIAGGAVTIRVLEGVIGKQGLDNKSRLRDDVAEGYVARAIQPGDVLHSEPVDRSLLLLADTPGVGGAHTVLRPGESTGATDLIAQVDPGRAYEGALAVNNFGNRYTGEYLLDGSLAINSPLHIGDQLSLRALASNEHLLYGRIAYQLPVGYDGLHVGVAYAATDYELGKEFKPLGAHGNAENASVYAVYPFIRTLTRNLYGTATLEDKRLKDYTDTPSTNSYKVVDNVNLGLAGNNQDKLGGGGVTSVELGLIGGRLRMDATSRAIDALTADADGNFVRFTYTLNRLQRLTENNLLSVNFSGQLASKNLNSSEEISLGGINGVRAYPANEGDGDEGWVGNLELRHNFAAPAPFIPQLQAVAFYDIGSVRINHDPYNTADNRRTISGAGFGLNATTVGAVQLKTYVAWRTSGGDPQSEPDDRVPRFWFQLSKQF
jgi:hemolysin activation/secretion protein